MYEQGNWQPWPEQRTWAGSLTLPLIGGAQEAPPPAYQPHKAREFTAQDLQGISRATQEQHFALYRGYVQNTNEARNDLWRQPAYDQADSNYSPPRDQRIGEIWNWNGVKNHEMFFQIVSAQPQPLSGPLRDLIVRDFGSVERFLADLKAAAKSVRGWVMLVCDLDDGRLHLFGGDRHDHAVWNTVLLMGIDVFEHAYFLDHGRDRGAYIDAFLANLDWGAVAERARRYGVIR